MLINENNLTQTPQDCITFPPNFNGEVIIRNEDEGWDTIYYFVNNFLKSITVVGTEKND